MRAGKLRRKITIKDFTRSQGDYGEPIESFKDFATVWASIEPLKGSEYWEAGKQNAEVTTVIKIRHKKNIRPSMVITYGKSRGYEILDVINTAEYNRELILMCKEVVEHAKFRG